MTVTPLAASISTPLHALERIEQRLANLERALDRADHALNQLAPLVAVVTDTFDQHLMRLQDAGIDPGARIAALLEILEQLTAPAALGLLETLTGHLPNLQRVLDSELFSSGAVHTVSQAGSALAAAADSRPAPAGLMTLLRALRDPAVQRSLGFALEFARLFGHALEPAERSLPAQTTR